MSTENKMFVHRLINTFRYGPSLKRKISAYNNTSLPFCAFSCFPKSLSARLNKIFRHIFNAKIIGAKLWNGYGHNVLWNEKMLQKLDPKRFNALYGHYPFTDFNYNILSQFRRLFAVVTIRPLPDIVLSYHDHMIRVKNYLTLFCDPNAENFKTFEDADAEMRHWYIIRFVLPWYVRLRRGGSSL